MPISVCPAAVINAPGERVWELLNDPSSYGGIWPGLRLGLDEPPGPIQRDQVLVFVGSALLRRWTIRMRVEDVDAERRRLRLFVSLPFGIQEHNQIISTPLSDGTCRCSMAETSPSRPGGGDGFWRN